MAVLLAAVAFGFLLGAAVVWLLGRSRGEVTSAEAVAATERLRGAESQARADAEQARAEAARARTEVADAHTVAAQARAEVSGARAEVAEARAEASAAQAEVAFLEAKVVAADAQRDAALQRAAEIASDRDALVKEFKLLSTASLEDQGRKAEASAEQRLKATELLMAPVKESLEKFNARLSEVEKERVALQADLRQQVKAVQRTGEELRRETAALSTALRKPHVRGAWGELQLKRIVELSGMVEYCDFLTQATTQTATDATIRPDLRIELGASKFVYVDSKVPLSAFLDAQEATDERDRAEALAKFAKNVKTHVDQLSGKGYWKAEGSTPEFVVLFLPSEALQAEALSLLPDLHEYAATRNVILATPSTLIALLRAVAYSWKEVALAKSAAEVSALGAELYDRLATMGGNFDKLGRSLTGAVKAYNASVASLEGRVLVTARRMRDLKVTDAELAPVHPVEEPLRQLSAHELVEDAAQVTPLIGRSRTSEQNPDAAQPTLSGRSRAATLPEADELVRPQPGLAEVVESVTPTPLPLTAAQQGTMAR